MVDKRMAHGDRMRRGVQGLMLRQCKRIVRGRLSASVVAAVALLAVPSAGLALGGFDDTPVNLSARGSFAYFTPASIDLRMAKLVATHGSDKGRMMRFTPAGAYSRSDRSVTVAIRVDDQTARAISVRAAIAAAKGEPGQGTVLMAPTRYDLGMARGYRSFAQSLTLPTDVRKIEMPDLSSFKPGTDEVEDKPSRFNARIALEEKGNAGRAPRTLEAVDSQRVDVAGSYRLTRNLDVTAGLRYSQERDRLMPLTDGTRDSQAVYVGTQFRF
ncbi:hypothetical protein U8326_15075 [Tsuneonella sp. CC-YZS046]|uniref:hypothetical protein n=1 Tax=Tsuneonella sp. CC-YZS046 TaxID=3042152 RepID=UPI002D7675C6|nr:hypothetical protein [Tsuneonella sp. CC-YZS046]WRO66338.1 hypothetical protein U8326_15075 [Tsuneonella sp. CC-YZS046]